MTKQEFLDKWWSFIGCDTSCCTSEEYKYLQNDLKKDVLSIQENWIPIDATTPRHINLFVRNGVLEAHTARLGQEYWVDDYGNKCTPTHWLPIPQLEDKL